MAIKPILFNTEMVRAILDGRKGATRRIVKGFIPDDAVWGYTAFTPKGYISCRGTFADGYGEKIFKLPCETGDILYVRETWKKAPNGYYYYEDWQKDDIADVTLSNGTLVNTNAVLYVLEEYPTAYDVDKVVEQLENERKFWENAYNRNLGKEKARSYERAIEIVKGGGVE